MSLADGPGTAKAVLGAGPSLGIRAKRDQIAEARHRFIGVVRFRLDDEVDLPLAGVPDPR